MNFYYLHLHALDVVIMNSSNKSSRIQIDGLPSDTIFQAGGFWGLDNLSQFFLENKNYKVTFEKIDNIIPGANLTEKLSITKNINLPCFLYKLQFIGQPCKDEIGVYNNVYLVVSENALTVLRNEGVVKAEADLIDVSIEEYFATNRQFFWMPEPLRTKF